MKFIETSGNGISNIRNYLNNFSVKSDFGEKNFKNYYSAIRYYNSISPEQSESKALWEYTPVPELIILEEIE